jgi:hypothetical protein
MKSPASFATLYSKKNMMEQKIKKDVKNKQDRVNRKGGIGNTLFRRKK